MMINLLLILAGAVGGIVLFILIKWLFFRNEYEIEPGTEEKLSIESTLIAYPDYEPNGNVGIIRVCFNGSYGNIIVEEIDRVETQTGQKECMVKIKILEISMDRDCTSSEQDLLVNWGKSDWISHNEVVWNEKTAAEVRQEKIDGLVGNDDDNP